jgi:hypothetical protein
MPSPPDSFSSACQIGGDIDNCSNLNSNYPDTSEEEDRSPVSVKKESREKKGRWRGRHRRMSMDEQRKYNLNRGLEYISRSGKTHKKRKMKSACNCPRKCYEKIEEAARNRAFQFFWNLGSHTLQWDFISKYVSRLAKKRTVSENSKRNYTLRYVLPVIGGSGTIEKVSVCQLMFLNTFSIGYGVVNTALDKSDTGLGIIEGDLRGKHSNRQIKISQSAKESVCSHAKMFQPVETHYARKAKSKIYLDGSLTFVQMFNLYTEWCDEKNIPKDCRVKTLRQYRDIVNLNFNFLQSKKT